MGEIWGDMGRHGEIQLSKELRLEIWGDMGRYGETCRVRRLPRVALLGAPLDRRADEARVDKGADEADVVLGEHALDAARKRLHDALLDAAHQPKVEEDEPPVVG